jgi:hypothetical protein
MPLTEFQIQVAGLLLCNRAPESHLAGGAALHLLPNSTRYSNDLDFFHDSVERVADAYQADIEVLSGHGFDVAIEMTQPGYVRASVSRAGLSTQIEWAHDSAWRFMPPIQHPVVGCQLHPIDLAVNKVLTLAGRDEARDFLDILFVHREILPLGALVWAAVGKDPGFTPFSLLELLRRRGKYRSEDFKRLHLARDVDLQETKSRWLLALEASLEFISRRDPDQAGCLYYSGSERRFVAPADAGTSLPDGVSTHFGRPGGVLPRFFQGDALAELARSAW